VNFEYSCNTGAPSFCGSTGGGASVEEALQNAHEYADLLINNDSSRVVEIAAKALCEKCRGSGRSLKPRTRMTYVECKACRGSGGVVVAQARKGASVTVKALSEIATAKALVMASVMHRQMAQFEYDADQSVSRCETLLSALRAQDAFMVRLDAAMKAFEEVRYS
jgi:excinuclease UvrABC ATPase subunit